MSKKKCNTKILIFCMIVILVISILGIYLLKSKKQSIKTSNISLKTVNKFVDIVPGVFILNDDKTRYKSIGAMFDASGFDVMMGDFNKYNELKDSNFILIVPQKEAEKLTKTQLSTLSNKVKKGQAIITDGESKLSKMLNVKLSDKSTKLKEYFWSGHKNYSQLYSKEESPIKLRIPVDMKFILAKNNLKVLAYCKDKNNAIAVSGKIGKGNFIYTAIPLAMENGNSYDNFPFIMESITEDLNIKPVISRNNLAVYLDTDYESKNSTPEEIAERVKQWGFNQVNISSWQKSDKNINYMKNFIKEAHKRGISVYAWTELPMVGKEFWDKYPEWREITASGKEAHIDWRYLMAIEDPACLKAVKEDIKKIIQEYDFDGIDIAEIYFESPMGFNETDVFTPMHKSFREAFKKKHNVDPIEIFNSGSQYYWKNNKKMKETLVNERVALVNKLHSEMLDLCNEIKKDKPYLQTMVTAIDSLAEKSMKENIGVNAQDLVNLQNKYSFMLQIEDPFTLWNLGPERYKVIGEGYRNLMKKGEKLSIDINIIGRGENIYPTAKQHGIEIYQLIHSASKYTDKVCLYAVCTMEDQDMKYVPYVQNKDINISKTKDNEYNFKTNNSFVWETDTNNKSYLVNGKKWPLRSKNALILPIGKSKVTILNEKDNLEDIKAENINANVLSGESKGSSLNIKYESKGRVFLTVNKRPSYIAVDNKQINPVIEKLENSYTIFLPEGQHEVEIRK